MYVQGRSKSVGTELSTKSHVGHEFVNQRMLRVLSRHKFRIASTNDVAWQEIYHGVNDKTLRGPHTVASFQPKTDRLYRMMKFPLIETQNGSK